MKNMIALALVTFVFVSLELTQLLLSKCFSKVPCAITLMNLPILRGKLSLRRTHEFWVLYERWKNEFEYF
jgi:hypothetical protein